ncbi:MAG TPA: ATP-binding cassette domain-containing protein, partial [Caulobacteraceae bacterium]|nr:ATP-binding cassette domain-containing protein [Caulobacteraceae bacterium]
MNSVPFLAAQFTGKVGVFDIDAVFCLPEDGVTVLIGPSGSGKSTVLRCIAGLTRLDGRLDVDGEVWQHGERFRPPHERPIGYVFQDAGLLPFTTVRGNLNYAFRRAVPPKLIRVDEVVALLGLERLMDRSPVNLSGGERQRVALARALLTQPRLLLLDEPLSSLDAPAKVEIAGYIARLHAAKAIPILYVTHDAEEVRRLADHLLVMQDGRIVETVIDLEAKKDPRGRISLYEAEQALAQMSPDEIRL